MARLGILAVAVATVLVTAAGSGPAAAAGCHPSLPQIASDSGRTFTADGFARLSWAQRSSGGARLDYGRQIWRGRVDGRQAFLTFDEIPGTSGPNHAMAFDLGRQPAKPVWQAGGRYTLGERFVIRSGPLEGIWTVTNCAG